MNDDRLAWLREAMSPPRRSIVELIGGGVLDAELAALAWILVETRLPLIVGGMTRGAGKTTLLEALLDFLPTSVQRVELRGVDEDFGWLPEAGSLGWSGVGGIIAGGAAADAPAGGPVSPETAYLVAPELSSHLPLYTDGVAARTLIRAASIGYGIAATIHADRLEDVHSELRRQEIGLTEDELSYLGLVLIIRPERGSDGHIRRRVVAAHYARPLGRDEHGHTQRLPPAVLAVRDEEADRLDHFAWGVMPEIAVRLGRKAGDLEQDQADRAAFLASLVAGGVVDVESVRTAIEGWRRSSSVRPGIH
ncbi:MAG TPA: hypothetical protein VGO64_07215 [Candidatus Limnocylindrales bacterium]|nr:hypothetical protein [Candidatus Limnocylindrales bacterium]